MMRGSIAVIFSLFFLLLFWSWRGDPGWPPMAYDFSKNPPNEKIRELGRALFYDPILSADSTISCASCHSPYQSFAHTDHAVSHGIYDRMGTRNAPVLINMAWQKSFMYDGAIAFLDFQPLAPIAHPSEMGEDMAHVLRKLKRSALYPSAFASAFGDSLISSERMLKAISQFVLSLVSQDAKYDKVMLGQASFSEQESKGYALFQEKCASCHVPPLFTDGSFKNNGLEVNPAFLDSGRYRITRDQGDLFKFKVPTLRNISFSGPYMHDGRFSQLMQVVRHYSSHEFSNSGVKEISIPMHLSTDQETELVAFLLTLSEPEFNFKKENQFPKEFFKH